jgi:hypothetical protein
MLQHHRHCDKGVQGVCVGGEGVRNYKAALVAMGGAGGRCDLGGRHQVVEGGREVEVCDGRLVGPPNASNLTTSRVHQADQSIVHPGRQETGSALLQADHWGALQLASQNSKVV